VWHDNETEIDLLGFDQLVDTIVYLVQQEEMLPLTVGVFGDWGSGKSSLMAMARKRLETNPLYVCVPFSPWQHKDYDDNENSPAASCGVSERVRRQAAAGQWPLRRPLESDKQGNAASCGVLTSR